MTETTLQKTIFLRADTKTVWAYLTDPDKLAIWFHKPKTALQQGEDYAMYGATSGDKVIWGTVKTMQPFDLLEYTFTVTPMGEATSTVSWALQEVPGGTRLTLTHTGLPQGVDAFGLTLALDKGWDEHLGQMRGDINAD